MIDLTHASRVFEEYLDSFCREDEKIKLKIIHTQGVIRCAAQIAARMGLEKEDADLAELIALLHDIGRFEQIRQFDSFEPGVMDHAALRRGASVWKRAEDSELRERGYLGSHHPGGHCQTQRL